MELYLWTYTVYDLKYLNYRQSSLPELSASDRKYLAFTDQGCFMKLF
jgi:hypothetical protein